MAQELQNDSVSTFVPPIQGAMNASTLADEATLAACKMLDDGIIARQPRFNEIRKNEDMYNGVNRAALAGRSNIPFDSILMRGYMNTLLANTDEPVLIKYGPTREQDKMVADKVTAVADIEKGPSKGAWDDVIIDIKSMAVLAGRGFAKLRMGNQPKFYSELSACDHYDMVTEPQGGGDLDKHLFKFQMNIFVTKEELLEAGGEGSYDLTQTRKLVLRYNDASWFKNNDDLFNNKAARYAAFGIDIRANNYVGQPLYRLTEGVINFKGKWYYLVFSREAKLWIRFQPLADVFSWAKDYEGRGPWISFATNRNPFIFWSVAPADDVRPIGYSMKKVVNLTIDNLEKRNWDMKAYDPKIFTDPSQLLWRPNGLVKATLKPGSDIKNGMYEFTTPDTTNITINLTQFLDQFLGKNTGIGEARGDSDEERVGITVSNLQQVSKRMTLVNKNYRKFYTDIGVMFDYGLYQYLREPYAVKLIGTLGVRWEEEVTHDDASKEFTITVTSGLEEDERNGPMLTRRQNMFAAVGANPILLQGLNKKWYLSEQLKTAGYSDEVTRIALDTDMDGDEQLYAEAAKSIQMIVDGEEFVPINRNATTGYIQKIIYFAQDNYPLYPADMVAKMSTAEKKRHAELMKQFDTLIAYAKKHIQIAQANMQRRADVLKMTAAMNSITTPPDGQAPTAPQEPQNATPPVTGVTQ